MIDGRVLMVKADGAPDTPFDPSSSPYGSKGSGGKGKAKDPADRNPANTVFFGGVPFETSEGFLRKHFERVGMIVDFDLWKRFDGSSKGKGICEYADAVSAQTAIQTLHGQMIDGRVLMVKADGAPDIPFDPSSSPYGAKGSGGKGGKSRDPNLRNSANTVFFGGVPFETSENFLRKHFERVGMIVDFDLWKRFDGSSKGMGTCEFTDPSSAQAAIQSLNGQTIDGRMLLVKADGQPDGPMGIGGVASSPLLRSEPYGKGVGGGKGAKGGTAGTGNAACRIFFDGVPRTTTEEFLKSGFSNVGTVKVFDFWKSADGALLGKGTVEFDHYLSARRAVEQIHGAVVDGSQITVKMDTGSGKGKGGGKAYGKW